MKEKKITIEESIIELEKIVKKMENGEGSLEENIKWFDKGIKLINNCRDDLKTSEEKVKRLIKNEKGYFDLENIK